MKKILIIGLLLQSLLACAKISIVAYQDMYKGAIIDMALQDPTTIFLDEVGLIRQRGSITKKVYIRLPRCSPIQMF